MAITSSLVIPPTPHLLPHTIDTVSVHHHDVISYRHQLPKIKILSPFHTTVIPIPFHIFTTLIHIHTPPLIFILDSPSLHHFLSPKDIT